VRKTPSTPIVNAFFEALISGSFVTREETALEKMDPHAFRKKVQRKAV